MEKAKEILTVLLMLYIVTGVFVLLYQLLLWHSVSGRFGYTLLLALILLKGALIGLRCDRTEEKLSESDRSTLFSLIQVSLILFCLLLLITFLLKGRLVATLIALQCLIATIFLTKFINPFTRSNP